MKNTVKMILDYLYYCDIVETNKGNLWIQVNAEHIERIKANFVGSDDELNEIEGLTEMFEGLDYLEFIPDLGNDMRFGALTNSPAIYEPETNRLWWYPNYQIHNILERLIEDKEVIFTLAENS